VHLKKKLGQHFLVDQNVINKLVRNISPNDKDIIVEIGPGDGAMTKSILPSVKKMYLIEKDTDLLNELVLTLHNYKNSKIINQDILKYDFSIFDNPFRVIGNLPYNISTEIIFKMCKINNIVDMHFMLQKEVVDRISASPGNKNYGRLSVMIQYYCNVCPLFLVPPSAFSPSPKVDSMIVLLYPHKEIPHVAENLKFFSKLVRICFQQRRKTMRNSIKLLLSEKYIEKLSIDLTLRPEQLSVAQFVNLSNQIGLLL
jgi:16S rRNA (adenine1518-N6/adenine1519-N6)-dimethyltransferase